MRFDRVLDVDYSCSIGKCCSEKSIPSDMVRKPLSEAYPKQSTTNVEVVGRRIWA